MKSIEEKLWKIVFYKVIEELRLRIRKTKTSSKPNAGAELEKIGSMFQQFLDSATKFYSDLVKKLASIYSLQLDGTVVVSSSCSSSSRSYFSCYRCYICIGDLTRYRRDLPHSTPASWLPAAQYYRLAVRLIPDNGNAHNQLAVMSTYELNDIAAMYHYFRSLATEIPFPTTKNNLTALFEKNRSQARAIQEKYQSSGRKLPESKEIMSWFLVLFIRLQGVLFLNSSVDKLSQVKTLCLKCFEELLQTSVSLRKGAERCDSSILSESLLLRLFVMNIFTVWRVDQEIQQESADGGPSQEEYIEKKRRSVLYRHAVKITLEFFGRAVRTCRPSQQLCHFLAPISLFCDWLKCSYIGLAPVTTQDSGPWQHLWRALVECCNDCLEAKGSLAAQSEVLTAQGRVGRQVLWEELELQGFLPFQTSFTSLNFAGAPLDVQASASMTTEEEEEKNFTLRLSKIISVCLAASSSTEVNSECRTLHFDKKMSKFVEYRKRKVGDNTSANQVAMITNSNPSLLNVPSTVVTRKQTLRGVGAEDRQTLRGVGAEDRQFGNVEKSGNGMHLDGDEVGDDESYDMEDENSLGEEKIVFQPFGQADTQLARPVTPADNAATPAKEEGRMQFFFATSIDNIFNSSYLSLLCSSC